MSRNDQCQGIRFLGELDELVRQRIVQRRAGSYVASLVASGERRIAQKVGEEAVELVLAASAGDRDEQVSEAADLLFHMLVLLNANGITLAEVTALLEQRHADRKAAERPGRNAPA